MLNEHHLWGHGGPCERVDVELARVVIFLVESERGRDFVMVFGVHRDIKFLRTGESCPQNRRCWGAAFVGDI